MMRSPAVLVLGVIGLITAACGSASSPSTNDANPCATRGATYLAHLVEEAGGTCGALPDFVFAVQKDGTLGTAPLACTSTSLEGCTSTNTNCASSSNGVDCTISTTSTFQTDGSAASGTETVHCSQTGKTPCTSTYDVTLTRQ